MNDFVEDMRERLTDPYYLLLLVILAGATYLRFRYAFFEGLWVDEGQYGVIAKSLSDHLLEYSTALKGSMTGYPPVFMYLLALSNLVVGSLLDTETAIRIVSPVMGVAGVAVTYLLGREMHSREAGLLAAALMAVNPVFWFLSERILIGATFTTLYTATIFALYYGLENREYSRYALWSLGPLAALTVMTKQPAYTLGLVIPFYFLYKERKGVKEFIVEGVDFAESELYNALRNRNYHISAGLGLLTMLPWALRNYAVCGFPLCGLSRAARFADVSSPPAWASTGGPLYFITNLPQIVTLGVALLVALRIGQYLFSIDNPDLAVKKGAVALLMLAVSYLVTPKLVPMILLVSVALFATTDAEKLLWLWTGFGVGFMSIPAIKVPRYIVFAVPALLLVGSISLYRLSDWLSYQLESGAVTVPRVAAVLLLPLLLTSYAGGMQNVAMGGYAQLEPAGEWLDSNAPMDSNIAGTSDVQMKYYVYPRKAYTLPGNRSKFRDFLVEKNISYVQVDIYERAQAEWAMTGLPPYRLSVSTRQALRSGRLSPQQVVQSYGRPPEYLEPVKRFGRTQVPLLRNQQQAMVIIYRVNMTG